MSQFATGVTVVTTRDAAGRFHGITVSAFCSVSLDPPLVLICIARETWSHYAFRESGAFVVNFLASEQADISQRFASPLADKFSGVAFSVGKLGIPVLEGCLVNLECRLRDSTDAGDHSIFVGEVESANIQGGGPLVYFRSDYRDLTAEG